MSPAGFTRFAKTRCLTHWRRSIGLKEPLHSTKTSGAKINNLDMTTATGCCFARHWVRVKCASKNKVGHDGQQITPMLSPPVGKTPPKQTEYRSRRRNKGDWQTTSGVSDRYVESGRCLQFTGLFLQQCTQCVTWSGRENHVRPRYIG